MAKQDMWLPTSDDDYIVDDVRPPSLVPIFDPAFAETAIAIPSPVNPANTGLLHHASQTPPPTLAPPTLTAVDFNFSDDHETHFFELPEIDEDLEPVDFREWTSWSAPRRVAAVRHWIMHAAHKYGPVERWGEHFSQEWSAVRHRDEPTVHRWLARATWRVKMGWSALNYLEHAVEGELSPSVEEWRDLYTQSHQLVCQLWGEFWVYNTLDCMVSGPPSSSAHLIM